MPPKVTSISKNSDVFVCTYIVCVYTKTCVDMHMCVHAHTDEYEAVEHVKVLKIATLE